MSCSVPSVYTQALVYLLGYALGMVLLTGPSLDDLVLLSERSNAGLRLDVVTGYEVVACGCEPMSGLFVRECDECLTTWVSTMCRHAAPRCPRCGEVTE